MMQPIEHWIGLSRYDLDTARAMQVSGRYLYVVFCCQQAIEKALKAIIVHKTGEFPPRIHTLVRLAEFADIRLTEERGQFMRELSNYYIHSRYPGEMTAPTAISNQQSSAILKQTEECAEWLFSML